MNSRERCFAALRGVPADRVPVFPLLMSFAANRLGVCNGHAPAAAV